MSERANLVLGAKETGMGRVRVKEAPGAVVGELAHGEPVAREELGHVHEEAERVGAADGVAQRVDGRVHAPRGLEAGERERDEHDVRVVVAERQDGAVRVAEVRDAALGAKGREVRRDLLKVARAVRAPLQHVVHRVQPAAHELLPLVVRPRRRGGCAHRRRPAAPPSSRLQTRHRLSLLYTQRMHSTGTTTKAVSRWRTGSAGNAGGEKKKKSEAE